MQKSSVPSLNPGWPLTLCVLNLSEILKSPEQVILALSFWAVGTAEKAKEWGLFLSLNKKATGKQQEPVVNIATVPSQYICYSLASPSEAQMEATDTHSYPRQEESRNRD